MARLAAALALAVLCLAGTQGARMLKQDEGETRLATAASHKKQSQVG